MCPQARELNLLNFQDIGNMFCIGAAAATHPLLSRHFGNLLLHFHTWLLHKCKPVLDGVDCTSLSSSRNWKRLQKSKTYVYLKPDPIG